MKIDRRTIVSALAVAFALSAFGCAATPEGTAREESNLNSGEITVANYISHPKVVAIRQAVAAIDNAGYRHETNPGCDSMIESLTDENGAIRKLILRGGEGDFEIDDTYYLNEDGKVFFRYYVERPVPVPGPAIEQRGYFEPTGDFMFQVTREREDPSTDRLPNADERFEPVAPGTVDGFLHSSGC